VSQILEKPAGQKLFVLGLRTGRLANRLVLFASFIAFAKEHGHRVLNFTFHSYAHLFETTRVDIGCRYPVPGQRSWVDAVPGFSPLLRKTRILYHAARATSVLQSRWHILGKSAVTIFPAGPGRATELESPEMQAQFRDAQTVFAYGWNFRAERCVKRHTDTIKAYFRPTEENDLASRQAVDRLRERSDVVIGVHMRKGDYAIWKDGKYLFETSTYAGWMRSLKEQFPGRKVSFLICSNESHQELEFPGLLVGFGPGSPVGDLYALAKCDYVFGPVSTFSQWASFYGNVPMLHLFDRDTQIERNKFQVSELGWTL
jgi:hypothetical protein